MGIKKEMIYYYLTREWSSDDDRLKKDLELMGMDLKPLTINNIFTSFFSNHENSGPLHMTQLPLPRFWEVLSTGDIVAEGNKKGKIYCYPQWPQMVELVEWYDNKGVCCARDHYDLSGTCFHREIWSGGKKEIDIYGQENQEQLYLFASHNRALYREANGQEQGLSSIDEARKLILDKQLSTGDCLVLSDISLLREMPNFSSNQLVFYMREELSAEDISYLKDRCGKLLTRDLKLKTDNMNLPLIYLPTFLGAFREFRPHILILTDTQELEQIEVLVSALPDFEFHIAALTVMGGRLLNLDCHANVHLYPGLSKEIYEKLLQTCSIYLDISHAQEILDGSRTALENGMILYAFKETCHQPEFYATDHLFPKDGVAEMIDELSQLVNPEKYQFAYDKQKMNSCLVTREELKLLL